MPRAVIHPFPLELSEAATGWDVAVEWILGAMLVFMPAVHGVVNPGDTAVVAFAVTALAACVLGKRLFRPDVRPVWSWSYLPIALFVLLAVLQLVRLPSTFVQSLSPSTLATKAELLEGNSLSAFTLSFYPWGTRHDLAVVLMASVVFLVLVDVYRRPAQIRRLLTVVAAIGGAAALLALLQQLSGATKIYWLIDTPSNEADGGPFVNRNNYAQFINLGIGAAMGLLLIHLREQSDSSSPFSFAGRDAWEKLGSVELRPVWWLGGVIACGLASVAMSMSRGGTLSMLASLFVMTLLMARGSRLRAQTWVLFLIVLVALCVVFYVGFEAAYARLATLRNAEDPSSGRSQVYKDSLLAWRQYPLLGTGLGTFEVVYPMFDRSTNSNAAEFADSDWTQLLLETGAVGVATVLSFVAFLVWHYLRTIRARRPKEGVAAFGLGYGLLAVALQSFTDFGQHLPAIALLSAVSCGLLVSLSRQGRRGRQQQRQEDDAADAAVLPPRGAFSRGLQVAIAAILLAGSTGWVLLQTTRSARAAAAWDAAQAAAAKPDAGDPSTDAGTDDETFLSVLAAAQSAASLDPDDVKARYRLNYLRWLAISRQTDPETGASVLDEEGVQNVARVVDDLKQAIPACPTFGPLHALAGQLEWRVLQDSAGRQRIRLGMRLAKTDPNVFFAAGEVDLDEGHPEQSVQKFKRTVELDAAMMRSVIDVYLQQDPHPELAVEVAAGHPDRLLSVAAALRREKLATNDSPAWQSLLADVAQVKARGLQGGENASQLSLLAALYRQIGDLPAAAEHMRLALELDYGRVEWRLERAQVLAEVGRTDEAMTEARTCLRLRPTMEAARKLIGDLSVRAASGS